MRRAGECAMMRIPTDPDPEGEGRDMRVRSKPAWFRPHFDDEEDDDLLLEMAEELPGFQAAENAEDEKPCGGEPT